MKNLTMNEIRANNDFEEAKERYETCDSNRWKNQWWELLCEIFHKAKKWANKYILDPVNKIVQKIGETVNTVSFTYWITLLNDNDERVFEKIGKSDSPYSRFGQILKQNYCTQWGVTKYRINKIWKRVNEPAEGLESYLRAMLIKAHPRDYVPNDRFCCTLSAEEVLGYAADYIA